MNLFSTTKRKNGQYLFEPVDFIDLNTFKNLSNDKDICIPLVIDTEFKVFHYADSESEGIINSRLPATCQIRQPIVDDNGEIFTYPEFEQWLLTNNQKARHPVLKNQFIPIDYIEFHGYKCELKRSPDYEELKELPICEFVLYGHFFIAELYLLTLYNTEDIESNDNIYREDLNNYVLKKKIQFGKRTFCNYQTNRYAQDSIYTNWQLTIEGKIYRLKLAIFDTAALHGAKSYKVLAANTGVKLDAKELMKEKIQNMHIAYNEVPGDYDKYALGDLKTYEILKANAMNFKAVYDSLGIMDYYTSPRLSIGATVANLFRAKIGSLFEVEGKQLREVIETYCRKGNAQYLLTKRSLTSLYLAKVDGGRCRNNRPLDIFAHGALCDLDISGCYGEGQRSQLYPFGNPLILEFPRESRINQFPTLREFLDSVYYGKDNCELIYGLWFARVSTKTKLVFEQDFLASWFDMSFTAMDNDDNAQIDIDENIADILDTKTGKNKILLNEVINGLIQHDFLDWLFNVCGHKQRKELLDSLYIESAVIYPKSEQCFSIQELIDKSESEKGENTCILKYKTSNGNACKIMTENESYAWYGVNLGTFLIDDLIARRKTYPKKNEDGSVNSFNELYKLLVNTLYGIMASPYFDIGNTTVGNNITARARALAYYIEKGLYAYQIITDGGAFDLNNVVCEIQSRKHNAKISANDLCEMYHKKIAHCRLAPLGGYDKIELDYPNNEPVLKLYKGNSVISLEKKEAEKWINKEAFKHLQNLFPNVKVLHGLSTGLTIRNNNHDDRIYTDRIGLYEFEMKAFYTEAVFHSSANYWFKSPIMPEATKDTFKMRSYEKKQHDTIRVKDGEFEILDTYKDETPAFYFIKQLFHPETIERGFVFAKDTILKIGEYVQRQNSLYDKSILVPGDTYWKQGLLREFSLSQFTFRTMEQYKSWEKTINKMKDAYGQSIEMFFINKDGSLNYREMINWFDRVIDKNIEPVKALRTLSKLKKNHPRFEDLLNVKKELAKRARTFEYLYGDSEE